MPVPTPESESRPVRHPEAKALRRPSGLLGAASSPPPHLSVSAILVALKARAVQGGVALVVGAAMLGNLLWIFQDHQSPAYDRAFYLHIAWVVRDAFSTSGLAAGVSAIYHTDPGYAPLYMLVIQPAEAIKNGVDASLLANTLMLGGAVAAAAVIARRLFGGSAAVVSALFMATCPIVYALSRTTLVDILLVLLAAMAVMSAVLSEGFQNRRWSLLCGVCVGLAALTKVTAPGIVLLPLALTILLPRRLDLRRQLVNAVLAAIAALLLAFSWYGINLGATLDYIRAATSGSLAIGGTTNPLTPQALAAFASVTFFSAVGTLLVLVLIVAVLLTIPRVFRGHITRSGVIRMAIPISWFVLPFAVLAASHNQDPRYLAPGVTGLAILAAGVVCAIRPHALRWGVTALAGVALVLQYVSYVMPQSPASIFAGTGGFTVLIGPPSFQLGVPFGGAGLIYTRPPGLPNYASPIVRVMQEYEQRTGPTSPLTVCFLQYQEVVNQETIGYTAESSGVPLRFDDLSYIPQVNDGWLAAQLSGCAVALYIPGDSAQGREGLLNRNSAADRITPTQLAEFAGPRPVLPVGDGLMVEVLERR